MSLYHPAMSLVLAAACTLACAEQSTSESAQTANTPGVSQTQDNWPMPKIETRIAQALEEIGPEQQQLRQALTMDGRRLRHSRREVLSQLSPRTRGILRRHNIRPLHLARHFKGDSK